MLSIQMLRVHVECVWWRTNMVRLGKNEWTITCMTRTVTIFNTRISWAWKLWRMTPSKGYPLTYSPVSLSGFLVGIVYLRPEGWLDVVAGAKKTGCGMVRGRAGRGSCLSTSVKCCKTLNCMKWSCDTNQFTNAPNGLLWYVWVWSWVYTKGNGRVRKCIRVGWWDGVFRQSSQLCHQVWERVLGAVWPMSLRNWFCKCKSMVAVGGWTLVFSLGKGEELETGWGMSQVKED